MKLRQLIRCIGIRAGSSLRDFEVSGLSCDSKQVRKNSVFVAIKGARQDANKFIREAIENQAKAVIYQGRLPKISTAGKNVTFIKVDNTRRVLARLACEYYGDPSSKIKVVGVTGTNGKTTITYLIEAVLKKAGLLPAVIGTVNYRFKDKIIPAKNTTPGPLEINSILSRMARAKVKYCIMEVSSHALDQERIGFLKFHSAVFTNLTQDHLDYHGTMENYFKSKARLFEGLGKKAFSVVNIDDKYGIRIKNSSRAPVITYGINKKADFTAQAIRLQDASSEFLLKGKNISVNIRARLIGKHNIYNMLACAAWAKEAGIAMGTVKSALEEFSLVPGRLERIDCRKGFSVFVDYAHTEDALSNVITSLRALARGKIIAVFGCGGDRDMAKRPKMGRVVTELADYAIITNDNPRSERPSDIIRDIKKGIRKNNLCVIPERMEAINKALMMAGEGDIVLIAGKGHENYQILKDRVIHFDDREAVKECLHSMNY